MTESIEVAPPVRTARHALRPSAAPSRVEIEHSALRAERERVRRARAAHEAKVSRLRLYSYCLTLAACVLALMSFMYLTQGTADGDPTFTWLGVAFVAGTGVALWSAVAITKLGEVATP